MKLQATTIASILLANHATHAFAPLNTPSHPPLHALTMTTDDNTGKPPLMDMPDTTAAKNGLIETAEWLKEEYGIFLIDKVAQTKLKEAVQELEDISEPPGMNTWKDDMLGEWELVCTTSTAEQAGIDTSKIPFFDVGPLKQIRDSIRKTTNTYLKIEQIVKCTDGVEVDRVDHVLEYDPPKELQDVLDNLPEQLVNVNINPLSVSKSKLILIHKAQVDSESPLQIKLSLKSIVLNVAGTSTFLEPDGKDLAGINIPLGDLLNSGTFETTYMDDLVRVSRGKQGFVDVLRVFTRPGAEKMDELDAVGGGEVVDAEVEDTSGEAAGDAPSDVEE